MLFSATLLIAPIPLVLGNAMFGLRRNCPLIRHCQRSEAIQCPSILWQKATGLLRYARNDEPRSYKKVMFGRQNKVEQTQDFQGLGV